MFNNPIQMPWKELGTIDATAGDADAAFTVGERTYQTAYALRATNCVIWYPVPRVKYLEFRFRGKTNGDNHIVIVWGARLCDAYDTDLSRLCSLDVETGTQVAVNAATNYTLFADEITLTNELTLPSGDVAKVVQSGNDTELMARLILPAMGYDCIVFQGVSTTPNSLKIDGSGYNE